MVSFKMFAGTNVGLRENNEDNFTVCPDLTKGEWIVPADNQQVIRLGSKGCIMAVADGMGGQNAGEVASAIAIDTVRELFSPIYLPVDISDKSDAIKLYLKKVIAECDIRIKNKTKEDPDTFGMGSTIVIAWLINNKLYIAWLGDSRAYSFISQRGIARLSKDHSYVQQLVDVGALTDEEAMNHPNSNVITRSLGDTSQKAKADVAEYDVEDGQVILLCSDGLCGVCHDEEIGGIIEEEITNLQVCKEKLTAAALAAGGSDNITISLLQVSFDSNNQSSLCEEQKKKTERLSFPTIVMLILGLGLLLSFLYAGLTALFSKDDDPQHSIDLYVDKNILSLDEETQYHISQTGGSSSFYLDYDKSLLSVVDSDSVIRIKNIIPPLFDITTVIKVVCDQNPSVGDSVRLTIKKTEFGGCSAEEKVENAPQKETKGAVKKEILNLSSGEGPGGATEIVTNSSEKDSDTTRNN